MFLQSRLEPFRRADVALYERAAVAIPATAHFNRALDDRAIFPLLLKAAKELAYGIGM